jgi:hypothetical protein
MEMANIMNIVDNNKDMVKFNNISNYEDIYKYNMYKKCNTLENIIELFINDEYYKSKITSRLLIMNKNISENFIYKHMDIFNYSMENAIHNCNISIDFIIKNLLTKYKTLHEFTTGRCINKNIIELAKDKYILSSNVNLYNRLNLELKQFQSLNPLNQSIIENKCLEHDNNHDTINKSIDQIIENAKFTYTNGIYNIFNLDGLSSNFTLSSNFINNNLKDINAYNILHNKSIITDNFEFIFVTFLGEMSLININHSITPEMIESHPELKWDYNLLYNSLFITEEFIEKNIDKISNWFSFSKNPNISFEFIKKHSNKNWNWLLISKRVTFNQIINNLQFKWSWLEITKNPNITLELIFNNPHLPWVYHAICENPNLTMQNINTMMNSPKYKEFLDVELICSNEFIYNPVVCKHSIEKDITDNNSNIKNIFNNYINQDFIQLINSYTYYN